jgi:hypothetical protein
MHAPIWIDRSDSASIISDGSAAPGSMLSRSSGRPAAMSTHLRSSMTEYAAPSPLPYSAIAMPSLGVGARSAWRAPHAAMTTVIAASFALTHLL